MVTSIRVRRCLHSNIPFSLRVRRITVVWHTSTKPDRIFNKTPLDLSMQRRHTLIIKKNLPTNQDIQNNTKTPNINFRTSIHLRIQEFRRSEIHRTTESREIGRGVIQIRQSKVDNFDISSLRYFNLQVYKFKLGNPLIDSTCLIRCFRHAPRWTTLLRWQYSNLSCELSSDAFAQSSMADDIIEHLSTIHIFENHVIMMLMGWSSHACRRYTDDEGAWIGKPLEASESPLKRPCSLFGS